ncbi:Uncharacterised protein [Raoultella terrigena]|uniref:Uncharacterized protein n=1 Tax=Raoultella terrigena TaxID=577 RepID=A0A4U9D152_RAOTE|nr:Uncharacterised protein [Raoultella terrigena]
MAAVNAMQRFIVRRLQPQLQPDFVALLPILRQQVQHRFGTQSGRVPTQSPTILAWLTACWYIARSTCTSAKVLV